MTLNSRSRVGLTLAFAIAWGWVQFSSESLPTWATLPEKININPRNLSTLLNRSVLAQSQESDFSGDKRSGQQTGGGGRGNCPDVTQPVTALIPTSNSGKTLAERPTFWFYVPYSPKQVTSGEFVIQDEAYNDVYRTAFTLPNTPGFVNVSLQSSNISLEINKWYRLYFKLFCPSEQLSAPIMVQGWVQRIPFSSELRSQLDATKPREDKVYTTHLIWYDAIAHLAGLRLNDSSNATLKEAWKNLLGAKGVGLEMLNQEPIAGPVIISGSSEN